MKLTCPDTGAAYTKFAIPAAGVEDGELTSPLVSSRHQGNLGIIAHLPSQRTSAFVLSSTYFDLALTGLFLRSSSFESFPRTTSAHRASC